MIAAGSATNASCVKVLLNAGANKEHVAHVDRSTALALARQSGAHDCVSALQRALCAPPSDDALPRGRRVELHSLQAKPELNGQRGTVIEFDRLSGRFSIALYNGSPPVALKPANVMAAYVGTADVVAADVMEAASGTESADADGVGASATESAHATASCPVSLEELSRTSRGRGHIRYLASLLQRGDIDPNGPVASDSAGLGASATLLSMATTMMMVCGGMGAPFQPAKPEGGSGPPLRLPDGRSAIAQPAVLRILLDHNAEVDGRSASGATPLIAAAGVGLVANVELLLEHAADVNAADRQGATALHRAVAFRDKAVAALCTNRLLASPGVKVDTRDRLGYTALVTAVEHGADVSLVQALLDAGADVNVETSMAGFTAISVACAGGVHGAVDVGVTKLLLGAKANLDLEWASPSESNGIRRSTEQWAEKWRMRAHSSAFYEALCDFDDFDYLSGKAVKEGAMTEAEMDEITDALARGETASKEGERLNFTQEAAVGVIKLALEAKRGVDIQQAKRDESMMAEQAKALVSEADGAAASALNPKPGEELPRDKRSVCGGRVRLHSLQSAQLNGQMGRIVSWNEDGKRRFGVRLLHEAKTVGVKARNLQAVDVAPPPEDFTCNSTQFCASLENALLADGSPLKVVDWTPHAATTSDVVHLLFVAHRMVDKTKALFFQKTEATEPLFLAHRELILHNIYSQTGDSVTTVPWMLIGHESTIMPAPWEKCCHADFMQRLCLQNLKLRAQCCICLEEKLVASSPCQLPCVHFICSSCLPKLYQGDAAEDGRAVHADRPLDRSIERQISTGLTCPVCKHHFPNHSVISAPEIPGGVAIAERTT